MNNLSIGKRLAILTFLSFFLILLIAGLGWRNSNHILQAFHEVEEDNLAPLALLARIDSLLNENTLELFRAMQHDPRSPIAAAHDHPVSMHADNYAKRRAELSKHWDAYMTTRLDDEQKRMAADFAAKRKAWVDKASAVMERLSSGDFSERLLLDALAAARTDRAAAQKTLQALRDYQEKLAADNFQKEQAYFRQAMLWFAVIIALGLIGLGVFSWWLSRSITRPIQTSVGIAEAIAAGDLTRPVPQGGRDEAGRLLAAFANMQDNLRAMVGSAQQNAQELTRAAQELKAAAQQASAASASRRARRPRAWRPRSRRCRFRSTRCATMRARRATSPAKPARSRRRAGG